MPALAVPFEERTFREGITNYVAAQCRLSRVRRQDVDDLIQESLTRIFASLGTFRAEKGDFETWARGIAFNVIRRHLRNVKRYGDRFSEYHPNVNDYATPAPSPERCAQHAQARSSIKLAAESMKSIHVQVLVFHAVDDMPHGAIARILSISEENSKKCYQRARDRFAQCLDNDLLSVMPLSLAICEDLPIHERRSRWTERSHYLGQIAALLMAVFCVSSLNSPTLNESTVMETRVLDQVQAVVMYRRDQPTVHLDAPNVKPEPASLPSVPAVSVPTRSGDKRAYVQDLAPLPPYKHDPASDDHLLFGDECP
jgi:RNA polymerase sigma factor (sigma-70 family)